MQLLAERILAACYYYISCPLAFEQILRFCSASVAPPLRISSSGAAEATELQPIVAVAAFQPQGTATQSLVTPRSHDMGRPPVPWMEELPHPQVAQASASAFLLVAGAFGSLYSLHSQALDLTIPRWRDIPQHVGTYRTFPK